MSAAGSVLVEATLAEWGQALADAIRREDRGRLESPLFDVQRRQIIGYDCYYEFAPAMVRALADAGMTPARVAAWMRQPLRRPYFLQIFEMIVNPLLAREQRLLSGDPKAREEVQHFDRDELPDLTAFVSELVREYRGDSELGPTAGNDAAQQVLDPEGLAACLDTLRPAAPGEAAEAGRLFGAIALHSVLLHGEHRDGIFDHGPYSGPDGTTVLVREINDLANTFMPWSTERVRLSVSGIAVVYACRGLDLRFDLFGGASTDPIEFGDRVERIGYLCRRRDELITLDSAALKALAVEASEASAVLFEDVAEWDDRERVLYGAHLYANHLLPFAELADLKGGDKGARIVAEFVRRGREIGTEVVDNPHPEVTAHAAEADAAKPLFTPPTRLT
jgi:hypothetical protein